MILFEKFGYIVENIEIEKASEVFRILSIEMLEDEKLDLCLIQINIMLLE